MSKVTEEETTEFEIFVATLRGTPTKELLKGFSKKDLVNMCYELFKRQDKALNNIDMIQEIIYQQPTDNRADDFWIIDKFDGIKNILKGEE